MKYTLLAIALALPTIISAQTWSVGVRSGIGRYCGEQYVPYMGVETEKTRTSGWEKEVFVRRDGKRFGFEAALMRNSEKYNDVSYGLCGTGMPDVIQTGQRIARTYTGLHLRAQYQLPTCPKLKALQHSVGVAITPLLIESRMNPVYFNNTDGTSYEQEGSALYRTGLSLGVEDLVRYRIGKHWDAQALFGFRFNGGAMLLRQGMTAQLGIGYRF